MLTDEGRQLVYVYLCQLRVYRLLEDFPAGAATPVGGVAVRGVVVLVDEALIEGDCVLVSPHLSFEAVVVLVEALLLTRLVGIQAGIVTPRVRDVLLFRLVLEEAVHVFRTLRLRVTRSEEVGLREEHPRAHQRILKVGDQVLLHFGLIGAGKPQGEERAEG